MNDIELCQELIKRAEEYQKRKEREFAIAELEKVKAEIDNCLIHNPDYDECNVNIGLGISYEIIKKHISELKGEQNG